MQGSPYNYQFVAVCAGCGLEIESWDDALMFRENGKRIYVHNDFDCLKEATEATTPLDEAEFYPDTW